MKRLEVIKWLTKAEEHARHLSDAAKGDNTYCAVFDENSMFATKLMNSDKKNLKKMSDIEAVKQNIYIYVDSWIVPNIRRALEEVKKEPRWKRKQMEAERRDGQ